MTKEEINILIIKALKKECIQEEERRFENWLDEKPENKAFFEEMKLIWEESGDIKSGFIPEVQSAWDKVKNSTDEEGEKKKIKLTRIWLRYAAAIIVAVVFSGYIINYLYNEKTVTFSSNLDNLDKYEEGIILPDNSKVFLNRNSKIGHKNKYGKKFREIELQGEAFFDVERDTLRPFIVYASGLEIRVMGTSFNVRAFPADSFIIVTVETGEVMVCYNETGMINELVIVKGEKAVFNKYNLNITSQPNTNLNYLAWKTHELIFNENSFEEVISILSEYYNTKIDVSDIKDSLYLTSSFYNQSLNEVLDVICATLNLNYEQTDESVRIYTIK